MDFELDRAATAELLGESSHLAPFLSRFEYRPEQQQMLSEVIDTFNKGGLSLIEAGTGVGKTLAYLIPSLLWAAHTNERIVISTHTIALQEQLLAKDLPDLISALDISIDCALVKGMHHYLCLSRLEQSIEHHPAFSPLGSKLRAIEANGNCSSNDLRQLPALRCEGEHCNGSRCTFYNDCHFFKARRGAEKAQVLIVNHHILLLDYLKRLEDPNSSILPTSSRLIIDEAHHLDKVATSIFAKRLSIHELSLHLDSLTDQELPTNLISTVREVQIKLSVFTGPLSDKVPLDQTPLPEKKEIEKLVKLLTDLQVDLAVYCEKIKEPTKTELSGYIKKCKDFIELIEELLLTEAKNSAVRWAEPTRSSFLSFCEAQIDTGSELRPFLKERKSTLLCSATLTSGGSFGYLQSRLGIVDEPLTHASIHPSPFDFESQAAFFVPTDIPTPDNVHFVEKTSPLIESLIHACDGGVFILCTSYRQLDELYESLAEKLDKYEVLRQGEASRTQLLETFRSSDRPVLFATSSFWEGVDVAGKMRGLVIAKLPFQVPSEPLTLARFKHLESEGKNPFMHYTLPEAMLRFTQGFGRLIRSKTDRGLCLCLDVRLHQKSYGKKFLKGLLAPKTFAPARQVKEAIDNFWSVTESNR